MESTRRNAPRAARDAGLARRLAQEVEAELEQRRPARAVEVASSASDASDVPSEDESGEEQKSERPAKGKKAKKPAKPKSSTKKAAATGTKKATVTSKKKATAVGKRKATEVEPIVESSEPPPKKEKRRVWTDPEIKLLKDIWKRVTEDEGRTQEEAARAYCVEAKKRQFKERPLAACQKVLKRKEGHSTTYHWPPEQVVFVHELKTRGVRGNAAYVEYEAKASAEGWTMKSIKAVKDKVQTVNDVMLREAQAALSGTTDERASRAKGRKHEWTPEEDSMVIQWIEAGKTPAECRDELLATDINDGPGFDRTEQAIKRRYKNLVSKKVRTVLRSRAWGKADDLRLEKMMKDNDTAGGTTDEQEKVIRQIAELLAVRMTFVRRRWEWISRQGRKDIQYLDRAKDELAVENQEIKARVQGDELGEMGVSDEEDLVGEGEGMASCPSTPKESDPPASRSIYDDDMFEMLRSAAQAVGDGDQEAAEETPQATDQVTLADALTARLTELSAGAEDALAAIEAVEAQANMRAEETAVSVLVTSFGEGIASAQGGESPSPSEGATVPHESERDEQRSVDGDDAVEDEYADQSSDEDDDDSVHSEDPDEDSMDDALEDWKEDMSRFVLHYIDDTGKTRRPTQGNLDRFREYVIEGSSIWKDIELTRRHVEDCNRKGHSHFVVCRTLSQGPTLTRSRVRLLMFVCALLAPGRPAREALLREFWCGRYGKCRGSPCGLEYDWDHHDFDHYGGCRHWEYYYYQEVHFSGFVDKGDYRLAAALTAHRLAISATSHRKWEAPEGGWRRLQIEVGGYGFLTEMFESWPDEPRFVHALCTLGAFSVLRVTGEFVDETWSEFGWQHGAYGRVFVGDDDRDGYPAILVEVGQVRCFVTTVGPLLIEAYLEEISWRPMTDVEQYLRRFSFVDDRRIESLPLFEKIVFRDYSWTPRKDIQAPSAEVTRLRDWFQATLNDGQRMVMDVALTRTGIILNRGPYGCGKTTLIAGCAVMYAMTHPQERVLIVSETNAAVDEDLERILNMGLLPKETVLRVGNLSERMERYREHYLYDRLEGHRKELEDEHASSATIGCLLSDLRRRILGRARIVVATLGQMSKGWMKKETFHFLINDEGAQTLETSLLLALRSATRTALIVGDEQQLKGHVPLEEEYRENFGRTDRPHKITWSLMHAMKEAVRDAMEEKGEEYDDIYNFPGVTSLVEYRSHSRITAWLQVFYDYQIECRAQESPGYLSGMSLPASNETVGQERIVWYGMERAERVKPEVQNMPELLMGVELLLRMKATMKRAGVTTKKKVFIISPYNRQIRKFNRAIKDLGYLWKNYLEVETSTTDSSQGREAEVVVVSMVRQCTMGFLKGYPARTLVSLSRAKDYLFVLAKWSPFQDDEHWKKLRSRAEELEVQYRSVNWTSKESTRRLRDRRYLEELANGADRHDPRRYPREW